MEESDKSKERELTEDPCIINTHYGDTILLTLKPLDENLSHKRSESDGAICNFIGTTRNSFQGKTVTKLEYEAYVPLALKTMANIVQDARKMDWQTNDSISHIHVGHRLGHVPPTQSSIFISVSSPHRKQAFLTCEWILEQVKLHVPIWKREWYDDEETEPLWKANFPPPTKQSLS